MIGFYHWLKSISARRIWKKRFYQRIHSKRNVDKRQAYILLFTAKHMVEQRRIVHITRDSLASMQGFERIKNYWDSDPEMLADFVIEKVFDNEGTKNEGDDNSGMWVCGSEDS